MYAPTANGTTDERSREHPQITDISPNVDTNSLKACGMPLRACCDAENSGNPNIRCAQVTPIYAPMI